MIAFVGLQVSSVRTAAQDNVLSTHMPRLTTAPARLTLAPARLTTFDVAFDYSIVSTAWRTC